MPGSKKYFEDWLKDEIELTYPNYKSITVFPNKYNSENINLPHNCRVINIQDLKIKKLDFLEIINCVKIVFTDFFNYDTPIKFFRLFRYNLALIKSLQLKAKLIASEKDLIHKDTIIYAYWAGDLATTACIIKQYYKSCKVITRGHGFEIFEEQTRYNLIPFRKFQYKFLDKLFADSKKGLRHLNNNNKRKHINDISYVGSRDCGIGLFESDFQFTIVTCSFIREIKRLHLMSNILKDLSFDLIWHIIGEGPDMDLIIEKNKILPSNITVVYHGRKSRDEVLEFYKKNHINLFVSLSFSEGLPVSMIEAISFGIPLMSTDVGGCREICTKQTGILIPKKFDNSSVAKQIIKFKESEKNTINFRLKCRRYWENNFNAIKNYNDFSNKLKTL